MITRQRLVALALALVVTVASVAIVLVALDQASGEQLRARGDCCEVEFIDTGVLLLTWLLFPLVVASAWFSPRVALLGALGMTVPQWLATNVVVARYDRSGWSDGLEVLGYAVPVGVGVLSVLAVGLGWWLGRLSRRAHDQ